MKLRPFAVVALCGTLFVLPVLAGKPKRKHPGPPPAPPPAASPAEPSPAAVPSATPAPPEINAFGTVVAKIDREVIEMVRDPRLPRIYATTSVNTVAVINTETFAIDAEIAVGSQPRGLDVSPDGAKLYVASSGATLDAISIIDLKTLKVTRSLDTTRPPTEVVAGLGGKLFVLSGKGLQQISEKDGDLQADSEVRTSPPVKAAPEKPKPEKRPDGLEPIVFLAAAAAEPPRYTPVALAESRGTVAPFEVSVYGGMIRLSPDRRTLYYGNTGLSPNTLYLVDVSGKAPAVLQKASIGSNGQDLLVSPNGESLCYPSGSGNHNYDITLIPAHDLKGQIASFPVGPYPRNGAFSADGAWFYTAPSAQTEVKIYDVKKGLQKLSFKTPRQEFGRLLCDSTGAYLFAASGPAMRKEERKPLVVFAIRR